MRGVSKRPQVGSHGPISQLAFSQKNILTTSLQRFFNGLKQTTSRRAMSVFLAYIMIHAMMAHMMISSRERNSA